MISSGIRSPYKTNRPLTDVEREHQLKQTQPLAIEPIDQLSVIKANSTCLEVVDKYYALKGYWTMAGVVFITALFLCWLLLSYTFFIHNMYITFIIFTFLFGAPAYFVYKKMLRLECFTYTHYPVRFNRKTRMVHIFMIDGRQLSVPWDEVFFCLSRGIDGDKGFWDLRGHILDKDGKTVLDTFAMMRSAAGDENLDVMQGQWEFVRRYMEEDHVAMINKIQNCMPIDGKYETWKAAWNALMTNINGKLPAGMAILRILAGILFSTQTPFRMLAMHTSKLPLWNKEIEAANIIEADDPYIKDSRINPEVLR